MDSEAPGTLLSRTNLTISLSICCPPLSGHPFTGMSVCAGSMGVQKILEQIHIAIRTRRSDNQGPPLISGHSPWVLARVIAKIRIHVLCKTYVIKDGATNASHKECKNKRGSGFCRSPLVFAVCRHGLSRGYVCRTRAFPSLSDFELHPLAFVKIRVAAGLDFRMMDEQILSAIIGADESIPFVPVKPFYCTCCHCTLLRPCRPP